MPGSALLILVFLTIALLAGGMVVDADWRIREIVQAQASSAGWQWLEAPAHLIVNLGNRYVAIPALALITAVVAVRRRALMPAVFAATAVVLLIAIVIPMKILIGRPSPGYTTVEPGGFGAFPSGHTSTASVCYAVAVLLLLPDLSARGRRLALAGLAVVCVVVGIALLWCDYHWVSDVIAGWAVAAIIVPLALRLSGRLTAIARRSRRAGARASGSLPDRGR